MAETLNDYNSPQQRPDPIYPMDAGQERDMDKEREAIGQFGAETGRMPESQIDWDKVAEYAYGQGYTVRKDSSGKMALVPPPTQIPDVIEEEKGQTGATNIKTPEPGQYGEAFFKGGDLGSLIRFEEDPDGSGPQSTSTVFWVDPKAKDLVPILSEEAFNNHFTETLEQVAARNGIQDVSVAFLNDGMPLAGYTPLGDQQGIQSNGKRPPTSITVDESKLINRYGQPLDEESQEWAYNKMIHPWLKMVESDPSAEVSAELVNEIRDDQNLLALYISAVVYGNYQLPDIYRDMKRRQLVKDGNTELQNLKVIDEAMSADEYYSTTQGSAARTHPSLTPPDTIGGLSLETLQSPIFNLPDEVYEALSPPFDWTTSEGKLEMEKVKSAYHDVMTKQLEATTEQASLLAKKEWDEFKEDMARNYGIRLSDNANQAWGQIQQLGTTFSDRGIRGSGIHQQALDKYLQDVRKTDERSREQRLTTEDRQERQYYLTSATPKEIAALSEEKKIAYGLKPSADMAQWFSLENLKKEFPNRSDEELKAYSESIIDPGGSLRSDLYQNYSTDKQNLLQSKKEFQLGMILDEKSADEEKAYREFTKSDPFSKVGTRDMPQKTDLTSGSTSDTTATGTVPDAQEKAKIEAHWKDYFAKNDVLSQKAPASPVSQKGAHVANPDWLKHYKPDELQPYSPGDKIYLKPGVETRWK